MDVPATTVEAVLASMGVSADDAPPDAGLPATIVARRDRPDTFHVPALDGGGHVHLEDGGTRDVGTGELPEDLPDGYHTIEFAGGRAHLVVTPGRCPRRADLGRAWGWLLQLYALRSTDSWGMGDYADLARFAERSAAELGTGFVVCNPLHATTPALPVEPSPYYPSSRRYADPLYLRVEDVAEHAALDPAARDRVAASARIARAANRSTRLDRDAVFRAKHTALETVYAAPRSDERTAAFAAFRKREGQGLVDFATFCALAEQHGTPFTRWPQELRHPRAPGVDAARRELSHRVAFHTWLQWLCDEQLAGAQAAATGAGMPVGIVHDLAVGVDPGGADAWALQDDLAGGVTVGAPPDAFNPAGQDWRVPPLRPDRLGTTGYAPLRSMLRRVLRHAGGVRIDHVLGLLRLYWIPEGATAQEGTYVRYPADDLLGVVALEASRAGALVIGEDLGTVAEGAREQLRDAGLLGSSVLYFERTWEGAPRPSWDYPEQALASVTTHDLATATGWWRGEAVRVQAELGLLDDPAGAAAAAERERAEVTALLRAEGLVGDDPTAEDLVVALHAFLARTPALLVAATVSDAVGDLRQPNLPGTLDEYPNWRLPLADADGSPVLLEELFDHPLARRLAEALRR